MPKKIGECCPPIGFIATSLHLMTCATATDRYSESKGYIKIILRDRNPLWGLLAEQNVGTYEKVYPARTYIECQTNSTCLVVKD